MLKQHDVIPLILESCPSFAPLWQRHFAEYEEPLLYVAAGDFARHLLAMELAGDRSCFIAIGAVIERLHVEGDGWVQEFTTIGILEGIQNVWSNDGADPERFCRWLGPESKLWWQSLNDFWSGKIPYVGANPLTHSS